MNCDKCDCKLEDAEERNIRHLIALGKPVPKMCSECIEDWANDWDEKRIDVIGQNGNTGDHYEH